LPSEATGGVQTVVTLIKPGFSKFSATFAGNANYAPSAGVREVRIPQATLAIVGGTTEGAGPLEVRVTLTDPETGAPTAGLVTSVIARGGPAGGIASGAPGRFVAVSGSFSLEGLRAGGYTIEVRVSDLVGSQIYSSATLGVQIAPASVTTTTTATSSPPTTTPGNSTKTISSPVNNSVVGTAVKVQINDPTNVARVDWYVNNIPIGSDITPADPLTFNAQGWGPGPFTLKAVVVDGSFKETTTRTVSFSIG
jgi:hypothetical protein